jgi:hypothetical protein
MLSSLRTRTLGGIGGYVLAYKVARAFPFETNVYTFLHTSTELATMSNVTAALEALTPELFEIVLQYLEIDDVQQLRLVSRETCFRATQDRYVSFAARNCVELTPTGLKAFARMTSQGCRLGYSVQHLIIVGVLYDSSILEEALETDNLSWFSTKGPSRGGLKRLSEEDTTIARKCLNELHRRRKDVEAFRKAGQDLALLSQAMRDISNEPQHKLDTLFLISNSDHRRLQGKQTFGVMCDLAINKSHVVHVKVW